MCGQMFITSFLITSFDMCLIQQDAHLKPDSFLVYTYACQMLMSWNKYEETLLLRACDNSPYRAQSARLSLWSWTVAGLMNVRIGPVLAQAPPVFTSRCSNCGRFPSLCHYVSRLRLAAGHSGFGCGIRDDDRVLPIIQKAVLHLPLLRPPVNLCNRKDRCWWLTVWLTDWLTDWPINQ